MARLTALAASAVAMVGLLAGCTSADAPVAASTGASHAVPTRSESPQPQSKRPIVLSCADSAGQGRIAAKRTVNGVAITPSFAGKHGHPDTIFTVSGPDGHRYLLWKLFLNVAATAKPHVRLTVQEPAAARLYYADPERWGTASDAAHVSGARKSVQLAACGKHYAGYTGGIVLPHPACVTLAIRTPGESAKTVTIPIGVKDC
jgi:hypothetical protein